MMKDYEGGVMRRMSGHVAIASKTMKNVFL